MTNSRITPAQISWQKDHDGLEVPVSENFGDVYFSRDNGLAETQHVFLAGNKLEERLAQVADYTTFTVGELGFGTGLNILALWQLWRKVRAHNHAPHARLHVITTELFPLTKQDLQRALASWSELQELSAQLVEQYPPLITGLHRLEFADDSFSIDLWLGDALTSLQQVQSYTHINAWFLDGFAPKCNESLWATGVLEQIKRLSGVGTTVATFSVAGVIKRGLQEQGFDIAKIKGFGRKREMLTAVMPEPTLHICETSADQTQQTACTTPQVPKPSQVQQPLQQPQQQHIAVIGAGIAGLCTAYSFAQRGHTVTLIDKTAPVSGSSGNPRAMLAPKLTPIHHVHEHMHSISYLYSSRFYSALQKNSKNSTQIFEPTQVYDLLKQSNVSAEQINEYPQDFACMVDAKTASATTHVELESVMQLEKAGLINPHAFAEYVLAHENIEYMQAEITSISDSDTKVSLTFTSAHEREATQDILHVDTLVICTAQDCSQLAQLLPTPRTTRGQISWFAVTDEQAAALPKVPLKYGGYCALIHNQNSQQLLLGASFIRGTTQLEVKDEEHTISKDKLCTAIPSMQTVFETLPEQNQWHGRAGLRAQMPDYLPLVGKVTQNTYSLCALGAKGFAYAPVCAEHLASMVCLEVSPLPQTLAHKLNPLRFHTV